MILTFNIGMNEIRDILSYKLSYNVAGIITEYLKDLPFLKELSNKTNCLYEDLDQYWFYDNYAIDTSFHYTKDSWFTWNIRYKNSKWYITWIFGV